MNKKLIEESLTQLFQELNIFQEPFIHNQNLNPSKTKGQLEIILKKIVMKIKNSK
jgi:hypothetical protein